MSVDLSELKKWYEEHKEEIQNDFCTFLRHQSVGADPSFNNEMKDTVQWLTGYLEKIGVNTEVWETPGHPVIYGEVLNAGPSRPTVMVYGHYDVQPVDPLHLWITPPFEPTVRDNHVYARGAMDNKGQCFYSITAVRAFLALSKKLNVNIKFFIEGEEECGSTNTPAVFCEKYAEKLKADHLMIVDAGMQGKDQPGVTLGLRGLISMSIRCRNASQDLHSGVHGGIVYNPLRALIQALGKMWNDKGSVAIPGFYDGIKNFTEEELKSIDMRFDPKRHEEDFGIKVFHKEEGYSQIESNWLRPSLEVNGINGGYAGEGFKTVMPAVVDAKVSCRLVQGQDPDRIRYLIENFLRSELPEGMLLEIDHDRGGESVYCSADRPINQIAKKAYEEVFENPCNFILCGATVPIVTELQKATQADVAILGVGLDDDNIHAPNERFGLDRFEKGFLTMGRIFSLLGQEEQT